MAAGMPLFTKHLHENPAARITAIFVNILLLWRPLSPGVPGSHLTLYGSLSLS